MFGGPEPESGVALVAPTLRSADVVVGQGEGSYATREVATFAESAFPPGLAFPSRQLNVGADPSAMSAFRFCGFNVIHLAGNHIWDRGIPAIEDTIKGLRDLGIAFCGAGMNIDEARKPAIIERNGTRFGFLSYNCTGPKVSWATPFKPGCAYVQIFTAYELEDPCPGARPMAYSFTEPVSLKAMIDDVQKLRPLCDVLVVHFHKGVGFTPVVLATYEQPLCYAAIDAGADLILGDHAHILKGIEQYKGKTIFHNLSDFTRDRAASRGGGSLEYSRWWSKRLYGFEHQDPEEHRHPDAGKSIIAKCTIDDGRISQVSYLPCLFNKQGQLEILKRDERGQQVFDYMEKITREADLNARYEWKGDEVVIHSD